MNFNLE